MPYVKLDCGLLNSSLWMDRECREVFITALLMAEPFELRGPTPQIEVRTLKRTAFMVPIGWYGFVASAGSGILRLAQVPLEAGYKALDRLGAPDPESRSTAFEGRRLVRIEGGYLVLAYMVYRDRDYNAKDRMRRLRERRKLAETEVDVTANVTACVTPNGPVPPNVTDSIEHRHITRGDSPRTAAVQHLPFVETDSQSRAAPAPVPLEFQQLQKSYPKRQGSQPWTRCFQACRARLLAGENWSTILEGVLRYAAFIEATGKSGTEFVMQAATFCGPDRHYREAWEIPQRVSRANGSSEAWRTVLSFVRAGLYREQPSCGSEATDRAVRQIGGYARIGQSDDFEVRQLEQRFREVYES